MADGELTMFGKAYDTVGSTNKNLVLQTRGDLKIRWGNKYIDLIKNGKINVDVELIQKVSDVSEIVKDGIYLIEKEEGNEIWLSVGGTTINIFGEISDNYVAFVKEQDIDVDNKFRALSNIGFYYESMEKAKEKQIKKGLVFILDQNKLYYVEEGEFKEYTLTQTTEIPSPLKLKNITINGEDEYITGTTGLYFSIVNDIYMQLLNDAITLQKQLVTNNTISSEDFQSGQSGFAIYNDDENYIGEFDVIRVRKSIIYDEVQDVTYEQLRELMEGHKLYPRKQYRIIDFFNEWDCYYYDLTSEQSVLTTKVYDYPGRVQFYFPITVTAASTSTLEKEGYYCENKHWVVEYDPTFNCFLCEIEDVKDGVTKRTPVYARGRITKLTDEYGNSANYDFKHRLFKATLSSDDRKTWIYTYNRVRTETTSDPELALSWEYIHNNWDASADGNIVNNIINIPEPELEDYTLNGQIVQKLKVTDDYFLFDCSTVYPYNNNIQRSSGQYNIETEFHDNTFKNIDDCQINAIITECNFGEISESTILGTLNKCTFEGLSQMEIGKANQTIVNMIVQDDLTPNSTQWVQERNNPGAFQERNPLKINLDDVPRLNETAKKDCFIKTVVKNNESKTVFYIQLASDDNTPSGVICMWYGALNEIPGGYVICDGNNGTPDLRGKFIRAASDENDMGDHTNSDLVDNGNGTRTAYIQIHDYNLPPHIHTFDQITVSDNITVSGNTDSATVTYNYDSVSTSSNSITTGGSGSETVYNASASSHSGTDSHSHSINITCPISFSFTPTQQTDTFQNQKINIEPNAYALVFIMKL